MKKKPEKPFLKFKDIDAKTLARVSKLVRDNQKMRKKINELKVTINLILAYLKEWQGISDKLIKKS